MLCTMVLHQGIEVYVQRQAPAYLHRHGIGDYSRCLCTELSVDIAVLLG